MLVIIPTKTPKITAIDRLILGRLNALTIFGLIAVLYTPAEAMTEFGVSKASFYNTLNRLEKECLITRDSNGVIKVVQNLDSSVQNLDKNDGDFLKIRQNKAFLDEFVYFLDNAEKDFFFKNNYVTTNCLKFRLEKAVYIYINKYILINNTNNLLKKEKEINKEKERKSNLPVVTTKTTPKVIYPQSGKECEPYFATFVQKHIHDFPQLINLNIAFEAEQFFNYWANERQWVDNSHKKVKSIPGRVATWASNWCAHNKTFKPSNNDYNAIASELFGADDDFIEGEIVND